MLRRILRSRLTFLRLLKGLSVFLVLISMVIGTGRRSSSQSVQFTPQTLLVAHELADGSTAISRLSLGGVLLQRFGTLSASSTTPPVLNAHLALSGEFLFRSNSIPTQFPTPGLDTISIFNPDGALRATITPNTSTLHEIFPLARDFANTSIYMVDVQGGSNVIWHLDDPSTGASSPFVTLQYQGIAGITDLYFGGPVRREALYALTQTQPQGKYRVAKIDSTGTVQFFDNPEFIVPFFFDVGSVAVAPIDGNIYVATGAKIVKLDASGASLGSFTLEDGKPSLDVDVDGHIYAGHFSSTTGEIDVFLPSGKLTKVINVPGATRIIDILIVRPPMQ